MTKFLERSEVIKLRLQGKSYSEIKQIVNVSKSSLSLWLRNVQLTEKQISGLKEKKIRSVERFIKSMKIKRQIRLETYLNNQKHKWLPLSEREEFIAGLFLYSGEGNKVSSNSISISNTDPSVIKFSYYWMQNCLLIPREKIFLKLHLYDDMNIEEETNFWSKEIGIDKKQFKRPYIKKIFKN